MRPPFFKDWRFYSILAFFLLQYAFCSSGGFWFIRPKFGIITPILWLIVSLFVWHKKIFVGRIKIIAFSMFLAPLLFMIGEIISSKFHYNNGFIFSLCIDYYPIPYIIFNFLYGKLKRTHFTIFESFLLGIICIPILPTIIIIYIIIYLHYV